MKGEFSMKNNKKIIIAVAALLVIAVIALVCWKALAPKPVEGAKAVTITVIDNEGKSVSYDVHTDAEFLKGAMEEAKGLEFSGTDGEWGMMVETINGVTPDYNVDGAYWAFYSDLNGNGEADGDEYCMYGVDSQPIEDGEAYIIVYEVYVAA